MAEPPVVYVTGAGRGIGRACAQLLAEQDTALGVAANHRSSAEQAAAELAAAGARTLALDGDLADPDTARRHVARLQTEFGRVDALIHCAGVFHREPAFGHDDTSFDRTIRVNLHASFYTARAAAGAMSAGGAIVLVSSLWAQRGGAGRAAYCAAKAGVEALARVLAGEWADRGIAVHCVAPGWVATEHNRKLLAAGAMDGAAMAALAPARALLEPTEVAHLCVALASGDHPMLAGAPLRLDGDVSGWLAGV